MNPLDIKLPTPNAFVAETVGELLAKWAMEQLKAIDTGSQVFTFLDTTLHNHLVGWDEVDEAVASAIRREFAK